MKLRSWRKTIDVYNKLDPFEDHFLTDWKLHGTLKADSFKSYLIEDWKIGFHFVPEPPQSNLGNFQDVPKGKRY